MLLEFGRVLEAGTVLHPVHETTSGLYHILASSSLIQHDDAPATATGKGK